VIKLVPVARLRPGMYIHDLHCGWLQHDFVRNRFLVVDAEDVARIRALGVAEVSIDTARGLDPDAAPEAPAAAAASLADPPPPAVHTASKVAGTQERARTLHREANEIVRNLLADVRLGRQIETSSTRCRCAR